MQHFKIPTENVKLKRVIFVAPAIWKVQGALKPSCSQQRKFPEDRGYIKVSMIGGGEVYDILEPVIS